MKQLVAIALLVLAAPAIAGPKQKKEAKQHVDKATKLHKEGKFDAALVELELAWKLDPQPDLLFAIGQVNAKLGKCDDAATWFHKFASEKHKTEIDDVVDQAIAECKPAAPAEPPPPEPPPQAAVQQPPSEPREQMAPEPVKPPPPPVKQEPPPKPTFAHPESAVVTTVTVAGPSPWYRDAVGDAFVVGGVVGIVVGAIVYSSATSDLDAAESAHTIAEYNSHVDNAHEKRTDAVILFGAGGVLVAAGVVKYALHARGAEHGVAVAPARGGGLVTWSGGF